MANWWDNAYQQWVNQPDPIEQYPTESQPLRAVSRYVRIVCDDCGHWFHAPISWDGTFARYCAVCMPMHLWYAGLSASAKDWYLQYLKEQMDGVL